MQHNSVHRFLVAGGAAALFTWLLRFPLEWVMPFAAAVPVATVIGMICGFPFYQRWVFAGSDRSLAQQVRDFVLVNLAGQIVMFLSALVLWMLFIRLGFDPLPGGALAHMIGIAMGALVNYLGHRNVTFSRSGQAKRS